MEIQTGVKQVGPQKRPSFPINYILPEMSIITTCNAVRNVYQMDEN
jgi:hypothetical protein